MIRAIKLALTWVAALWALIAGVLWYKASAVRVQPDPDDHGAQIIVHEGEQEADFIATALKQTLWNKRAAWAACTSAFLQGLALFLPD
jgi:hypothetical protein